MNRIEPKHPRAIRWMHWINFPVLTIMIWSGLRIYWANDAYDLQIGGVTLFHFFPDWFYRALSLEGSLAQGMAYHFAFMWFFAINGVLYTTGGTRRSVVALDATTGEIRWVYGLREGARAVAAPRQLSGRGLSYWTDGREERILFVTTGYRLVELNAKTGKEVPAFGKEGIIDLKVGMVTGTGQQIDLEKGEAGLHSAPTVVNDVVIVGSAFKEGMTVPTHNNTKGLVRAFDVKTGKLNEVAAAEKARGKSAE